MLASSLTLRKKRVLLKQACLSLWSLKKQRSLWLVELGSHPESSPYLVFWSSSLNFLDLCSQLYEPLACSPKSSMQDAVFSIISLKVLLISMLLLCSVDGPILPARSRVKLPPSILPAKAPSSQEVHLNISYAQGLINLEMAGDSQEVIWYLFRVW